MACTKKTEDLSLAKVPNYPDPRAPIVKKDFFSQLSLPPGLGGKEETPAEGIQAQGPHLEEKSHAPRTSQARKTHKKAKHRTVKHRRGRKH